MWILRGNWELGIFCILRKMCWMGPLYFLYAQLVALPSEFFVTLVGSALCAIYAKNFDFCWDCIMNILCGTSKLNYEKNRHQVVKGLHTNILHKGQLFFISVLDQCCGSRTFWTFYLWKMMWMYLQKVLRQKTFFKIIFCWHLEGSGSGYVQVKMDPDPGDLKTYGSGFTKPSLTYCKNSCPVCNCILWYTSVQRLFLAMVERCPPPPNTKSDKLTYFWLPDL